MKELKQVVATKLFCLRPLYCKNNPDVAIRVSPFHHYSCLTWSWQLLLVSDITTRISHHYSRLTSLLAFKFTTLVIHHYSYSTSLLTFNVELAGALLHPLGISGHALVIPGVLQKHLADHQGAAVTLKQQLDVLRLLHRLLITEPDHLRRKSLFLVIIMFFVDIDLKLLSILVNDNHRTMLRTSLATKSLVTH